MRVGDIAPDFEPFASMLTWSRSSRRTQRPIGVVPITLAGPPWLDQPTQLTGVRRFAYQAMHLGDLDAGLPRPGSTACWFQLDRGQMNRNLGILAYGSLIDEPGDEIAGATAEILREGITTPFPVEFARSSRTRAGAPTLVPVTVGGTRIPARIYILHGNVSEEEARDMLWRRETGRRGRRPNSAAHSNPGPNEVIIKSVADFQGVGTVLYTSIAANIVQLTPKQLAALALNSARSAEVAAKGRDGISYLMAALRNGVRTELSAAYEEEVLRQAGAATLADAIERVRFVGRVAAD